MKKLISFAIILFLYIFLISSFLPKTLSSNLKKNFFLYLREKINFKSLNSIDIFIPKYKIKKIVGDDFFIDTLIFNYFTKEIKIVNGIFIENFKEKILNLFKNKNYLNIPLNKIKLINCKIIYNPYIVENCNGNLDLINNKIRLSGFIEKKPFFLSGQISNNKINLLISLNNIKFNEFLNKFLKIPQINFLNLNKNISAKVELEGNLDFVNIIKFYGSIDNNTEIKFNLYKKVNAFKFNNGILKFFNDDSNIINFSGKIFLDGSWNFIFQAKDDYLKIPYKNSLISIKDVDFNYSINNLEGNEIGILKLYCSEIKSDSSIYTLFNYFFKKKNYSYSAFIDKLNIDNISVSNLDLQFSSNRGVRSIDKFNFNIDNSKILFSFINKEDTFKVAINAQNVEINNLIKFLFQKNLNVYGKFNVTFLGFGKNKYFTNGKGYIRGKDILINGINFNELDTIFKTHDIKNIKLFNDREEDSNDNITKQIKIFFLKSNININENKLYFNKIFLKSNNFSANLNGFIDPDSFSNVILTGLYNSNDTSSDIIINLNIKEKFIQFIGK